MKKCETCEMTELAAVRDEIRLVTEILRAFPNGYPGFEGGLQQQRFLVLLSRERELMAAQPAAASTAGQDIDGAIDEWMQFRARLVSALDGEMGDHPTDQDIRQALREWAAAVKLIPEDCLSDPEVAELHKSLEKVLDKLKDARADAFEEAARCVSDFCEEYPGEVAREALNRLRRMFLDKAVRT
jgi:hypothetical protein